MDGVHVLKEMHLQELILKLQEELAKLEAVPEVQVMGHG